MRAAAAGEKPPADLDFPTIDDGVLGMAFIAATVASGRQGAKWLKLRV